MGTDLEERFQEFSFRTDTNVVRGIVSARKVSKIIAKQVGYHVLMPQQVRLMAYLLGYNDQTAEVEGSVIGVTGPTYWRVIQPNIPLEGKVNLSTLRLQTSKKRYYREAYSVPAVEEAFTRLGQKGKLDYSPSRFREAMKKI